MKENIEKLLKSKMVSNYTISKETGIAQSTISGYVTGSSKIGNMKLDHAILLNDYYIKNWKEEMEKMEKINRIITAVENGKLNLVQDWQFHERDYMDGATDIYIEQDVEGHEELTVLFAEHPHIKEMREDVYQERKTASELDALFEDLNELGDQFDYDKVVAYRIDSGPIVWV